MFFSDVSSVNVPITDREGFRRTKTLAMKQRKRKPDLKLESLLLADCISYTLTTTWIETHEHAGEFGEW